MNKPLWALITKGCIPPVAFGLEAVCELGALTYDGYVVSGSDTIQIVPTD